MKRSLFSILTLVVTLSGTTINVPTDQATIQAGLFVANANDTVLVQPNTYYENIFWPETNGIKLISAGDSSNTIIDGGGAGSVIYMNTQTATIDAATLIQGFKITNGGNVDNGGGIFLTNADLQLIDVAIINNAANSNGGGMYLSSSSPTITDMTISGNSVSNYGNGGGMYLNSSSPIITDVIITGNRASSGGGMYLMNGSIPTFTNVTISVNTASNGGGMYLSSSSPTITDMTISGNSVSNYGNGGGMYLNSSSPIITDVIITGNRASYGGGMYLSSSSPIITDVIITGNGASSGGGMYLNSSSPIITDVIITGNRASYGGGMYLMNGSIPTFTNVTISVNTASNGGGMYLMNGSIPTFTNVTISGNTAQYSGGGIFLNSGSPIISDVIITGNGASSGGGMYLSSSSPTITGVTISGNSAHPDGGGMYLGNCSPTITGVTISGNSGSGMYLINSSPTVQKTLIGNNSTGVSVGSGSPSFFQSAIVNNGTGLFNSNNSVFLNATNTYWGKFSGPYHPLYNTSGTGNSVNTFVTVTPWLTAPPDSLAGSPLNITGLSLNADSLYQISLTDNIVAGDSIYIELAGFDTDTLSKGLAVAWVINTMSQDTIVVTLEESTITSGLFRGRVITSNTTDNTTNTILGQDGQVLQVISRINPNFQSTVIIGDTPLPILTGYTLAETMDLQHMLNHIPLFIWSYSDPLGSDQASYQVQVSSDVVFTSIDMWDSGVLSGSDTSVVYDGNALMDGTTYYARLQVVTATGVPSNYSEFSFRMNSPPEILQPVSPGDGIILSDNTPLLEVENGSDAETDALIYDFQLSIDEDFTTLTDSVEGLTEGSNITAWQVENALSDNYVYWWRARTNDGYENGVYCSPVWFILNASNDTPAEFALLTPVENGVAGTLRPVLDWAAAFDPDPQDTVRYTLYLDTPAPGMLTYVLDTVTVFQPDFDLIDHSTYYWKVVATDGNGGTRENTGGYQSFTVNTENDLPVAFNLLAPVEDVMVTTLSPEFLWEASSDPDDQAIALREIGKGKFKEDRTSGNNSVNVITGYDFYLGTDSMLTDVVAVEVFGTSYSPETDLTENQIYYWAVSALDDSGGVTFSDTASFWTNAENEAPEEFGLLLPNEGEVLTVLSPVFTWESSSDPDLNDGFDYNLVLGTDPGSMDTIWSGTDTTLALEWDLEDNKTYYWMVYAEDWSGLMTVNMGGYQSFTVNTTNDVPVAFELLYPVYDQMVTNLQPEFLWEASSDPDDETIVLLGRGKGKFIEQSSSDNNSINVITGYEFYLGTDIELTDVVHVEVIGTSYTPTAELIENQDYYWAVSAIDDSGGVTFSDTASFWTNAENDAPTEIMLLTPLNDVETSTTPVFSWTTSSDNDLNDEVSYTLQYGTDVFSIIEVYTDSLTAFIPTESLEENTDYIWQVTVSDLHGASYSTDYQSFYVNSENEQPSVFQLVFPDSNAWLSDPEVTLVWEPSYDIEGSAIEYVVSIGPDEFSLLSIDTISVNYYALTGLEDGYHYWQIEAIDELESSQFSSIGMFLVNANNDPPDPFVLHEPVDGALLTVQAVTFTWEPSSSGDAGDQTSYFLEFGTSIEDVSTIYEGIDTLYVYPDLLEDNTTYFWQVTAIDLPGATTVNEGGYQSFTVNTANDLPTAFELLYPVFDEMVTNLQPEFLWEASSDPDDEIIALRGSGKGKYASITSMRNNSVAVITGYDFYLGTDIELTDVIPVEVIGTSYVPAEELIENQVYYWTVSAVDDSGGVTFSDTASFWTNVENEAPDEFTLLLPIESEVITVLNPSFIWESTSDPDLQDGFDYNLVLGTDPGNMDTLWSGSDTTLTLEWDLEDNTTYYWMVFAEDWDGLMTFNTGGYRSFTVNTANDLPIAFELLYPVYDEMVTNLQPEFLWEASSDPDDGTIALREIGKGKFTEQTSSGNNSINVIIGYDFYLGTGVELTDAIPVEVIGTYYTPTEDLIENQVYYWVVSAVDDSGGVIFSDTASFWTNAENEAPEAFSLLIPVESEVLTVLNPTFTWEPSIDPDMNDGLEYSLVLGTSPGDMDTIWVGSDTTLTLAWGVEDNSTYFWTVFAEDWTGLTTSNTGGIRSFTVNQGNDIPTIVDLITPDSVMVLTLMPGMYWTPAFDADPNDTVTYEMHWWGDGIEHDSLLTDTNTVVLPTGLADNSLYFWNVIAMDQNGGISHSDEAFFWTNLEPEAPVGFALVSPENDVTGLSDMPAFEWEHAEDPDPMDYATYTLQIATDSSFSDIIFQTNTNADVGHEMTEALPGDTEYWWKVIATDTGSLTTESEIFKFTVGYVAIDGIVELPTEYVLQQNFPNPFNPSTTLRYGLPEDATVSLIIYDIRGNLVKIVNSGTQVAGWYEHVWNGMDESGQAVSTGLYLTRLQAGSYSKVIKMLFLK